jgi:hypothetical protein
MLTPETSIANTITKSDSLSSQALILVLAIFVLPNARGNGVWTYLSSPS